MKTRVLIAPAEKTLRKSKYAREYYLLENLADANPQIEIESYFRKIKDQPTKQNLSTDSICNFSSAYGYYLCSFNFARKKLKRGSYDIYHHMNFHYRFHNLLLVADLVQNTPTIIGPAQPPHIVTDSRKRKYLRRNSPISISDSILEKLVPLVNSGESIANVPRDYLFKKTLQNVDRLVAVNEETAELYAQYMPRSKIEVIPIGVALNRFELASPSESTDFVSVGNLHARKGFDVLLDAWSEIGNGSGEPKLHILGSGSERENLESQAKRLDISDSVIFHGHVCHKIVTEILASARAFVHPTRSEGYPHVRLEAMASGLPVIGTNITGASEMIRDGTDGIIVPIEDSKALANAMSSILNNPKEADRMGKNARTQATIKFDWKKVGEDYAQLYQDMAGTT